MFKFRITGISALTDGKYVVQLREIDGTGNASVTVTEELAKTLNVASEFVLNHVRYTGLAAALSKHID